MRLIVHIDVGLPSNLSNNPSTLHTSTNSIVQPDPDQNTYQLVSQYIHLHRHCIYLTLPRTMKEWGKANYAIHTGVNPTIDSGHLYLKNALFSASLLRPAIYFPL